jgi:type IV pilus assembly protein PilM
MWVKMTNSLLYKDKPVFGLDIGFSSLKVMQIRTAKKELVVSGYGVADFDGSAIKDGVIIKPEEIAKSAHNLFKHGLIGDITTNRVSMAIPAARTFNRTVILPDLTKKELAQAVQQEVEQYVPVPLNDLYVDYEVIAKSPAGIELLIVASPKNIVDSYVDLANILNIEPVSIETTIGSGSRLFFQAEVNDIPTVLTDFGSVSTDITIFDKTLIVTGTVPGGGDSFTNLIAEKLNVTKQEAHIIKVKYGLGLSKKQKEITEALSPIINQLLKEIRRMLRYYEERSTGEKKIAQIVSMGGGANMPGLSAFMTDALRLPVRMCDPWQKLTFQDLQPPNSVEKSMFITVAGLAMVKPAEAYS